MTSNNRHSLYQTASDRIPQVSMTDKCIVLDLDQTLVATQKEMKILEELGILSDTRLMGIRKRIYVENIGDLQKPGEGAPYIFWGIVRPHVKEFLLFCFSYFKLVTVWSAGNRKYVESIVDFLFKDIRPPHKIFTSDDTIINSKGLVEKPLRNLIDSDHTLKSFMTLQNVLALDDNSSTFSLNPRNGVLIPPYEPDPNIVGINRDDDCLLQFRRWLLRPEVMRCQDVTTLNLHGIFSPRQHP